jgi:hypothetical protein
MTRSQELQVKAILGRFDGDKSAAAIYCVNMVHDYPKLATEYTLYHEFLLRQIVFERENNL